MLVEYDLVYLFQDLLVSHKQLNDLHLVHLLLNLPTTRYVRLLRVGSFIESVEWQCRLLKDLPLLNVLSHSVNTLSKDLLQTVSLVTLLSLQSPQFLQLSLLCFRFAL